MSNLRKRMDTNEVISDLRTRLQSTQRALAKVKRGKEDLVDAIYQAAADSASALGELEPIKAPAKDKRQGPEEVALLHTTDWQVGKLTETYNTDVARVRLTETLPEKVYRLTEVQRSDHPVRKCVVLLGGDQGEGIMIFPGQAFEVDAQLYEQLFSVVQITVTMLLTLLQWFDEVEVWDMFGNHGRLGRKGEFPRLDNVDRMGYRIAKDRLANEPRLTWHHADTWYQIVEIGEYRACLVHGDQIKMFGGNLPAYGIVRAFNAWAGGVLPPFKDGYIGHFHTHQEFAMATGSLVYATGSPESSSAFAQEFVRSLGLPSQRLHYIDPVRGRVTAQYKVYLED